MQRDVGTEIHLNVAGSPTIELQVAVSDVSLLDAEELSIRAADVCLQPSVVNIPGAGRVHRFEATAGPLSITYHATASGRGTTQAVSDADAVTYLRPSRYAESDKLFAVAAAEFRGIDSPRDLLMAVSSWVGSHLSYIPGSSRPTDGAVNTLLQRSGVCRDYAHLVVALLRAQAIPARVVAVYAPGLNPMDFHAVAEAAIDGVWSVVDATLLAPRSSLLRICHGRDAADTAFLSSYRGEVELLDVEVTAVVQGDLPADDINALVQLG